MELIHTNLILIGILSYQIPFLIVLLNIKKYNNFSIFEKTLYFYVSYNAIISFVEQFILDGRINNFNPLYNILTIIDFCTIIVIFSKILHNASEKLLKLLNYIIVVYLIISISELLFINELFSINIYSNNLSKSLIIIIASITIYLSEIKITITKSQKIFIYTIFMYNILTLPISLFEVFIRFKANYVFFIIWSLNILFAILYNLSLTLALWKWKK
jgi:hypothetical protein